MKVIVSGSTFEHALAGIDLPRPKKQKKGFGFQYVYDVDLADARLIEDAMADAACVLAEAGESAVVEAIYKDMDRFEFDVVAVPE